VSTQTLRHYDRLGLLRPAATSAGGYRLYTDEDRGRLELIRALRALDLDLATIGRLMRGAVGIRSVAELHLRTLDLQARTLERRRAVLRVLLRDDAVPSADRLARLQALAGLEQLERERFLTDQLDRRLSGAGSPRLREWIRNAAVLDLPESPTEPQVEAWLELAEMVSDPAFLERHRARPSAAGPSGAGEDESPVGMMSLFEPGAAAARAGLDAESAKARPIVERWIRGFATRHKRRDVREFAEELLQSIDARHEAREQRFWQLVGVLKPEVARSPMSIGWPWLIAGLRAWLRRANPSKRRRR
jgi:DNA-binding transcriptional MerR regulator